MDAQVYQAEERKISKNTYLCCTLFFSQLNCSFYFYRTLLHILAFEMCHTAGVLRF